MEIPIQNIYYLLCYAWDSLDEGRVVAVDSLQRAKLADLFAHVLISGTRHVLRRGLDRGYLAVEEATARIHGRIDFDTSLKQTLLPQARAYCHFDELSHDVLHNQILKTTLGQLADVEKLNPQLRQALLHLRKRFGDVSERRLDRLVFHRVQLHSNNAFYRFLMNVCELVHRNLLVDERTGKQHFRDFLRDRRAMARLFEAFVFNFFRHEQQVYEVSRDAIHWDLEAGDELGRQRLPQMRTDVSLRSSTRTLVIETKYYGRTLQRHFAGKATIRSAHLYQLMAYLRNLERRDGTDRYADGLLLYPAVRESLQHDYTMPGHRLQVSTIDLAQPWQQIETDLLTMIGLALPAGRLRAG